MSAKNQVDGDVESQPSQLSHDIPPKHNSLHSNSWGSVLYLGFTSLGAIYGDIGTSPLYTFTTMFNSTPPTPQDVYGGMSCIFWLFTLVVIAKYCLVVLNYGPNNGEGGQVAIYSKIAKVLKIGPAGVKMPGSDDIDDILVITRSETHDSSVNSLAYKGRFNEKFISGFLSKFILALCFIGCGLVITDGLLTPTTSVLSAIAGIAVAIPSFEDKVLPVSCVVLLVLFLIQRWGSGKISILFSPIIFIWMMILLVSGIINISRHPLIFKSLNPKEAIDYLKREGDIDILGTAMLAITGAELMFADVGHFSPLSVQLTLGLFVYPCLMIAYLGQGSYLIIHPELISNIFFLSTPGGVNSGFYWFVFVIATLATVIASQALIIGVFSILKQMIQIDCFPKFKIIHTSSTHLGQIFIPLVNYLLMILVICTAVGFKNSNNITALYGLGVAMDFFVTTNLITVCLLYVYQAPLVVALFFFLVTSALDVTLIVAGLRKVPHGAWFPLMMSVLVFLFISVWRWGRSLKVRQEYNDRIKIRDIFELKVPPQVFMQLGSTSEDVKEITSGFIQPFENDSLRVKLSTGDTVPIERHPGLSIMYTNVMHTLNSPNTVPALFKSVITSFPSLPENFVFLGIRIATVPYLPLNERILLQPMRTLPGFYRCVIRFGFMDEILVNDAIIAEIMSRIQAQDRDEEFSESDIPILDTKIPIWHLFEKEVVVAHTFKDQLAQLSKPLKLFYHIGIGIRSLFIEWVFDPINRISLENNQFLQVSESESEKVLFVGNVVKL